MSKKREKRVAQQKKQRKQKRASSIKRRTLKDKLAEVYGRYDLSTTCCRQAVCCATACP